MSPQPAHHDQFLGFLRRVDNRLRLAGWLDLGALGTALFLGGLLVLQLLSALGMPGLGGGTVVLLALVALVSAAFLFRTRRPRQFRNLLRPDPQRAAAVADEHAELDDLLKTAYAKTPATSVAGDTDDELLASQWLSLLLRRAADITRDLDPRRIAPVEVPPAARLVAGLLVALAVVFWFGSGAGNSPGWLATALGAERAAQRIANVIGGDIPAGGSLSPESVAAKQRDGDPTEGSATTSNSHRAPADARETASSPAHEGATPDSGDGTGPSQAAAGGEAGADGVDGRPGEGLGREGDDGGGGDPLDGAGGEGDDTAGRSDDREPTADSPSADNPDLMVMEVDMEAEPGSSPRMRRVRGAELSEGGEGERGGAENASAGEGDDEGAAGGGATLGKGSRGSSSEPGGSESGEDALRGSAPGPQDGQVDPLGDTTARLEVDRQTALLPSRFEAEEPKELFSRRSRRQESELPYVDARSTRQYLEAGTAPATSLPWIYRQRVKSYFLTLARDAEETP